MRDMVKWLLMLLFLALPAGATDQYAEDLPNYTPQDAGGKMTVCPAYLRFAAMPDTADCWLVYDKGANHFAANTDFTHKFMVNITNAGTTNGGAVVAWALSNTGNDDWKGIETGAGDGVAVVVDKSGANHRIILETIEDGSLATDIASSALVVATNYYCTVTYDADAGDHSVGLYTLNVHTSNYHPGGTDLASATLSRSEGQNDSFRYIYAANCIRGATGGTWTGTVSQLDIGEVDDYGTLHLTVNVTNGWVLQDPNRAHYTTGTVVRLIPRPNAGYGRPAWTGDVSANEATKLVPSITMDGDKTVTATFASWVAPLGVPTPPFGLTETTAMYDDAEDLFYYWDSDNGRVGTPGYAAYKIGANGPYTHYIKPDDKNATDTANPFGSEAKPRVSLPISSYGLENSIRAGAVVEIHGSLGLWGAGCTFPGTQEQPIFIRGIKGEEPTLVGSATPRGACNYVIFENLIVDKGDTSSVGFYFGYYGDSQSNIAIRNCEFRNLAAIPSESVQMIRFHDKSHAAVTLSNILIYGCWFHHCGENRTGGGYDTIGVSIDHGTHDMWTLYSVFSNIGGDAIQAAADGATNGDWIPQRIYLGGNVAHDLYENFLDLKSCKHIISSQNTIYNGGQSYSDEAPYAGNSPFRFGLRGDVANTDELLTREYVWTLGNTIFNYDDQDALLYVAEQESTTALSDNIYFMGNLVHDCRNQTGAAAVAFSQSHVLRTYYLNNTLYNVDEGFYLQGDLQAAHPTAKITLQNNIVQPVAGSTNPVLTLQDRSATYAQNDLGYNLFYDSAGDVVIRYIIAGVTTNYTFAAWQKAQADDAVGSLGVDPLFVSATDQHLQTTSPCIDAGTGTPLDDICALYFRVYGVNIRKDMDGTRRTLHPEIGAYEKPITRYHLMRIAP